jgi:hypothetical protein
VPSRLGLRGSIGVIRRVRVHVETVLYGSCKIFVVVVSLVVFLCAAIYSNKNAGMKQFREIYHADMKCIDRFIRVPLGGLTSSVRDSAIARSNSSLSFLGGSFWK